MLPAPAFTALSLLREWEPMRAAPAFRVLGTLQADRDGASLPLPSRRQRALLAALLTRAGRPVPADELIEAAWGERLPDHPKAALQTVLSRLRAALGAELISAGISGYRLDVTADDVDALRFEALRERAAHAPDAAAAGLLDAALALWRGPAYAEFADRYFASAEAARLNELRAATIEDYADLSLRTGRATDAIAHLEALQASEPWRDRCVGLLMRALAGSGRATEALQIYDRHRRGLAAEFGLDPSPGLQDLQARILRNELPEAPSPAPKPPRWFAVSTPFVGRDAEMAALVNAVSSNRLVTVTGIGGVGKTRLVAESLGELAAQLEMPVAVAELGAVPAGSVDGAVASAFGLDVRTGTPRTAVSEYLGAGSQLLVIDNCEHVLADARDLTGALLRACPRVRIIATSRHRLGLRDEQVLPLDPLLTNAADVPAQQLRDTAPVRLFTDRVRRVRPDLPVTAETVALSAAICRRVDGVPLAIELAAAQAAAIGLVPVLDRLGDLDVLADADGGMRAVLDRSWTLLTRSEQELLARLSVFAADFDLDAVEHACGPAAATRLAHLADASLLHVAHFRGQARYRMLAIVRAFAAERLRADGAAGLRLSRMPAGSATWQMPRPPTSARAVPASRCTSCWPTAATCSRRCAGRWTRARLKWPARSPRRWAGAHWVRDGELLRLARDVARDPRLPATPVAALAGASGALHAAELGDLDEAHRLGTRALAIASTSEEQCLALTALGVTCVYRGDHTESMRYWHRLLELPAVPAPLRVDAHATFALLACSRSDEAAARQMRSGPGRCPGRRTIRGLPSYTMGEVRLREDPRLRSRSSNSLCPG